MSSARPIHTRTITTGEMMRTGKNVIRPASASSAEPMMAMLRASVAGRRVAQPTRAGLGRIENRASIRKLHPVIDHQHHGLRAVEQRVPIVAASLRTPPFV